MKATTWVERWKDSGTLLSEAEIAYLGDLVEFIDHAIEIRAPFIQVAPPLCAFADGLASVGFELLLASAAERIPDFDVEKQRLTGPKNSDERLSDEEAEFLADLKGVVEYGIRNGVTLLVISGVFAHDLHELERDGFSFEAAKRRSFRPKSTGFSKYTADSVQGVVD